jgi:hypothetical protein
METIDITPDPDGMIRWAKQGLREAPADSNDARVFRKVLAEYGITDEAAPTER